MTELNINNYNNFFFIGIAGAGMSAIAQYLSGTGKKVSGSDRQFNSSKEIKIKKQLENEGIECFPQDSSGLHKDIDIVVVSTAVEPTVPEYQKAVELGIKIVMRSDLLAAISRTKKTIAVSGTSGKSTVSAMIYHIMEHAGLKPSLITGAGLISIQEKGKIGNAVSGSGEYLIIEADESDGSLMKYIPETGIILNIEKDHKELNELYTIFFIFSENVKNKLIVNGNNQGSNKFSRNKEDNFGFGSGFGINGTDFIQKGFKISFNVNGIPFEMNQIGKHNAENALAAVAAAESAGVSIEKSSEALKSYKGIYRRHQLIGESNGVTIIDDYAHNPAKLAASIKACQFPDRKLIVWFQPHGFKPTKFLRNDFVKEISEALRENDEIWMSEIYYAGGTVNKDISAEDLIKDIQLKGKNAFFVENRNDFPVKINPRIRKGDVLLLTGARDPSLVEFSKEIYGIMSK